MGRIMWGRKFTNLSRKDYAIQLITEQPYF